MYPVPYRYEDQSNQYSCSYLQTGENQQNCSVRPASATQRLHASVVTPQPRGGVAELPTALEIILRAARTAKRGASFFAFGAQPFTHQGYAPWPPLAPSRRVGAFAPSLLRRPTGAGGGLRGRLPAAGATDLLLTRSFGAAAARARDQGIPFALRALALPRHNWRVRRPRCIGRTVVSPPRKLA